MGTVNPLGLDVEETWRNLTLGKSGVGPISLFDHSELQVHIAAEVKGFQPTDYMDAKEARRMDRFQQFAFAAVQEAVGQSGIEVNAVNASRVAIVVSSGVGGLESVVQALDTLREQGPRRVSPFSIPMFMLNGASSWIGIELGAKGPSFSIASACASGGDSIGQAALLIRSGIVDAALAGAAEATVTELGVAVFDRMGALSHRDGLKVPTPAPFDRDRDGLVMGEGAAVLVLEELDVARARGAQVLAELVGYGSTADAYHITAPAPGGEGGAAAIRRALESAALAPPDVDYINAHGTGTSLNDAAETAAIKAAFGKHAYRIPISSTKSMTGHLMGATGALEAIICVRAIRENVVPPTINLHHPDPECDLDYVPNRARETPVSVAISNAFGFGGHNAVLALSAFSR
jgi:3-oxoacyl-[acyl-carrier-protein] synthase II